MSTKVYYDKDGDLSILKGKSIGVLGYANQAKAQALNMRDSGLNILVGVNTDEYKKRAQKDKFPVNNISETMKKTDVYFILISDDLISEIYQDQIKPHFKQGDTIVLASGYNIVFNKIQLPKNIDVLLISPRVPGEGLRENYLNKKGVFSFAHVHQDASGSAKEKMLALGKAVGALSRAAVDVNLKQQVILNLFFEQTFTYGFLQIMMRSILTLVKKGYPPEAIFVELFLSGEGGYTMDKVIDVGMIKQMNFHSQTSQYGQMSRGVKFRKVAGEIGDIQSQIFQEIENGEFCEEWDKESSKLKLQILKYFTSKTDFAKIEDEVRTNLGFETRNLLEESEYPSEEKINQYPGLKDEIEEIKSYYEDL